MTKFNLKKAILENKATFFSSLTEGQFSWITQDTNQQIGSENENTLPFVYMFDNKGNKFLEKNYEGYGVFGNKDYYELLDQMNGGTGDRSRGINLAFDKEPDYSGEVLHPALVVNPNFNWKSHDFTEKPEDDPNQSWYQEEEEDDYNLEDYDEDDDDYLQEASADSTPYGNYINKARAKSHLTKKDGDVYGIDESGKGHKITDAADLDKYTKFTIKSKELNEGKMYYHVLEDMGYGEIGHEGVYDTEEEAQDRANNLSRTYPDSSFYVEASTSEKEPYNVTYSDYDPNLDIDEGKKEIPIDEEIFGFPNVDKNFPTLKTRYIAKKFAEYMSNKEGQSFTVTLNSPDGPSFDLDLDGEKYDGGSYLIAKNGDIINVALRERPVYGNISMLDETEKQKTKSSDIDIKQFNKTVNQLSTPENLDLVDIQIGGYPTPTNISWTFHSDSDDRISVGYDIKTGKYWSDASNNGYEGNINNWMENTVLPFLKQYTPLLEDSSLNKTEKPKTKMKKSELKDKIKEMVLAEMESNNMEDAPEDEVDFLAEVAAILAEADKDEETDTETTDTETTDTETADAEIETPEGTEDVEVTDTTTTDQVDPNVKAVQDALTQAQAAAQTLGDAKLTDQIGNTITFFTRTHVVDKGAVAEGEEMGEGKKSNKQKLIDAGYSESDAEDFVDEFEQGGVKVPQKVKDILSDKSSMNESMFPMLKRILK